MQTGGGEREKDYLRLCNHGTNSVYHGYLGGVWLDAAHKVWRGSVHLLYQHLQGVLGGGGSRGRGEWGTGEGEWEGGIGVHEQ